MPPVLPPREPDEPIPDLLRTDRKPAPLWRRVLYLAGAALALVAGVVGWLVPVVTGIPFWIAGIVLLALAVPKTALLLNALERKLPARLRRGLRRGVAKVPIRRLREAVVPLPKPAVASR